MKQEKGKINRMREEDKYHKTSGRTRRRRNKILRERIINENKRWRKRMCRRRNMKTQKSVLHHIFFSFLQDFQLRQNLPLPDG
jgi:hypothetical protein